MGIKTLLCDPPRADRGDEGDFRSLEALVQEADVITFHTPLYKEGQYKTLHPADEALISRLKPGTILISACRGPVVDNAALLKRLEAGQPLSVVLDVWEPEPDLNVELLKRVDIGTAHIAGYTLEGKARGTTQVFEAYSAFYRPSAAGSAGHSAAGAGIWPHYPAWTARSADAEKTGPLGV